MPLLQPLFDVAARTPRRIVFSEGADPRVIEAATAAVRDGLAHPLLVGDGADITTALSDHGAGNADFEIHDPTDSPFGDELVELLHELRAHKGMTREGAAQAAVDPHVFAALLVRSGRADGTIGGATTATSHVVRAALQVIGRAPDAKLVSSFFLMLLDRDHHLRREVILFSDAGLVIDPSAEEMTEIAQASAMSFAQLVGKRPRVAMLSFSTRGSAQHGRVEKVAEATHLLRARALDLIVDGELQFDAAFVPEVSRAKAPGSVLDGRANVFVFPSLEAGNIGYKIAQRIGGAEAVGPILQGLAKPANDLSRGCTTSDIVNMIAVTAAQCETSDGDGRSARADDPKACPPGMPG